VSSGRSRCGRGHRRACRRRSRRRRSRSCGCCRSRCSGRCGWRWCGTGLRAVSAASVQIAAVIAAPDDHLTSGPHCRVICTTSGAGDGGGRPTVVAGVVSAAGVQKAAVAHSAPDDHLAAGPHRGVSGSGIGCAARAGGRPTVRGRVISPASVQIGETPIGGSAPDNHFTASPHCRVNFSASGGASSAGRSPTVDARIVSPASIKIGAAVVSAPDDHFAAGPHCRVIISGIRRAGDTGRCPTVGAGVISCAGVQRSAVRSTPDDHFAAGPHCRV